MKSPILGCMLGLGCAGTALGQAPAERNLLVRMHSEAFEHSQAQAVFDMLTVTIGPRLTASPAYREPSSGRATDWPPMASRTRGWSPGSSGAAGRWRN